MQIGVIGFGRLGKLLIQYMAQDADIIVYDLNISEKKEAILKVGAKPASLQEVCQAPIIIPFVPISELRSVLYQISSLISGKNQLIIDVCSVKQKPVEWMKELLPKDISILGTHPMFGPDSAKETLFGTKLVLCQVRINQVFYINIKKYLESHGIKIIESTPEEHDRQIAHSLLLTHFIGRGLIEFQAKKIEIDTKGYRRLMKILDTVENDSWQLFKDMNDFNPYAKETRLKLLSSLNIVQEKLEEVLK